MIKLFETDHEYQSFNFKDYEKHYPPEKELYGRVKREIRVAIDNIIKGRKESNEFKNLRDQVELLSEDIEKLTGQNQ